MGKSVCIVGAGASGLCALKNIIEVNEHNGFEKITATVFEKSDSIGGVWIWNGNLETAMYPGLITNAPKEMMRFLDFPPEKNLNPEEIEAQSYIPRRDVLNYLTRYADFFNLHRFIRLNTEVMSIKRILTRENNEDRRNPRWRVTVQNNSSKAPTESEFDYVIICNGHHNKRKYPDNYEQIRNTFQGQILHSKDSQDPSDFLEKSVVLIGCGLSGTDLATTIAGFANQVYISSNQAKTRPLNVDSLNNLRQIEIVQSAKENSVILENGEEIQCDVVIFSTGYKYEFPFLEPEVLDIRENGKLVTPLYLHMIHHKFNSLCFIGIPSIALTFLMVDCQTRYYATYIQRNLELPSESEMQKHFDQDQLHRKSTGFDGTRSHLMSLDQWDYYAVLAKEAGFMNILEPISKVFKNVYRVVSESRFENPCFYRTINFESILQSEKFFKYEEEDANTQFLQSKFSICNGNGTH